MTKREALRLLTLIIDEKIEKGEFKALAIIALGVLKSDTKPEDREPQSITTRYTISD